jgi:hypothetical protein
MKVKVHAEYEGKGPRRVYTGPIWTKMNSPQKKKFLKIVQYQMDIEANTIKNIWFFSPLLAKNTRHI